MYVFPAISAETSRIIFERTLRGDGAGDATLYIAGPRT